MHPQNRGGMYPQPDVVRNLGLNIITNGFNQSEANHEGVSVEEIPCSERAAHSRSDGSPYEPYGDYNIRQCAEVAYVYSSDMYRCSVTGVTWVV